MNTKFLAVAIAAASMVPAAAAAHPVITVVPTLAPNAFGSPSWSGWQANSIAGLLAGATSYGTPGTPTYYETRSNVTSAEVVVTGFNSWLGKADPGTVFGPAFASELGNRMTFGLRIDGNGTQFSIDQLSFDATSSDPFNALAFSFSGGYTYNSAYVGLLKGNDGILFTADDIQITGGPSNQLIDGLVGRGSGNSFAAYCSGCSIADQQAQIDGTAAYPGTPFTFTGTYSLGDFSGSGTFDISAPVPEPATWAMMIGGFALAGAVMRRRRTQATRFA